MTLYHGNDRYTRPLRRLSLTVASIANGSATAYFPAAVGEIYAIEYAKTDYADTVEFNITVNETGQAVWVESGVTASGVRYPRVIGHVPTTGVAHATLAAAEPILLSNQIVKVVLAQAGDTKTGTFTLVIKPL